MVSCLIPRCFLQLGYIAHRAESEIPIQNIGIYEMVSAPWARSGPLSGRGPEARKRFTVASARAAAPRTTLSGALFYANRLSFLLVSRCASVSLSLSLSLSRPLPLRLFLVRREPPKRSQLLRHALPSLPYLRCNLFPGINAAEIFCRFGSPWNETYHAPRSPMNVREGVVDRWSFLSSGMERSFS